MTQEEILQMARETLPFNKFDLIGCQVCERDFDPFLLDFAALIIAREREECARICDERERANLYMVKECAVAIRARGQV